MHDHLETPLMEREEDHLEYTKLGNTGMDVSRICLGCMGFGDAERWIHKWVLNEENSRPIIKKALELGINFFDTANVYSIGKSEEILGRALKDFANRDEAVIATKVHGKMHDGPNGAGLSRKAILSEIDKSLQRLGMDYVDVYQIHRWDYQTPIEETMEALHDVVRAGKARISGPPPCSRGSSRRGCMWPTNIGGPALSRCRIT
jgi:1-deoxyxylulose-5-phosphate synthase